MKKQTKNLNLVQEGKKMIAADTIFVARALTL